MGIEMTLSIIKLMLQKEISQVKLTQNLKTLD